MSAPLFTLSQRRQLLALARKSIESGLNEDIPLIVQTDDYDPSLASPGAAFVTLEKNGELRGCIGSVEAYRPLVEDIAQNAWNAAFRDPRFSPVASVELPQLQIEISILTQPVQMTIHSEEELKQQLRPGQDGLILSEGYHRGLFLPAVWDKLPDVESFVQHLKQKAGLPTDYWSSTIRCKRFASFEFSEENDSPS